MCTDLGEAWMMHTPNTHNAYPAALELGLGGVHELEAPALELREPLVHPEQPHRKQRRLVPARACGFSHYDHF